MPFDSLAANGSWGIRIGSGKRTHQQGSLSISHATMLQTGKVSRRINALMAAEAHPAASAEVGAVATGSGRANETSGSDINSLCFFSRRATALRKAGVVLILVLCRNPRVCHSCGDHTAGSWPSGISTQYTQQQNSEVGGWQHLAISGAKSLSSHPTMSRPQSSDRPTQSPQLR